MHLLIYIYIYINIQIYLYIYIYIQYWSGIKAVNDELICQRIALPSVWTQLPCPFGVTKASFTARTVLDTFIKNSFWWISLCGFTRVITGRWWETKCRPVSGWGKKHERIKARLGRRDSVFLPADIYNQRLTSVIRPWGALSVVITVRMKHFSILSAVNSNFLSFLKQTMFFWGWELAPKAPRASWK